MTPIPGQKIGPYEVIELLGSGGMGHVLRAWDRRLHREVALKLLRSDFQMPNKTERFLREARAASALTHPNICTIYDLGEYEGNPFLVMELLEGETLRERMSFGPIAVDDVIRYGEEIAEALAAAHSKGIVHRDVKPANIFLVDRPGGRRQVKVLDFGLAKVMRPESERNPEELTTFGATVGTVSYMSPEQARGEELDSRSDLFSLGVVLYEMASGEVPFHGATSALVFVKLLREAAPLVRQRNAAVPEELEDIIDQLLTKHREDRLQSASLLAQELQSLRSGGRPQMPDAGFSRSDRPSQTAPSPSAAYRPPSAQQPAAPPASAARNAQLPEPARPAPQISAPPAAQRVQNEPPPAIEPPAEVRPQPSAERTPVTDPVGAKTRSGHSREPLSPFGMPLPQHRARISVVPLEESNEPPQAPVQRVSPVASPPVQKPTDQSSQSWPLWVGVACAALLIALGLAFMFWPKQTGPKVPTFSFKQNDNLLLTPLLNQTGNTSLGMDADAGLQQELASDRQIHVLSSSLLPSIDPVTGRPLTAADMLGYARKLNARAYLIGEIRGDGPPYTFTFSLIDAATGNTLSSSEQTLTSSAQLNGTVSQIAAIIRTQLGGSAAN